MVLPVNHKKKLSGILVPVLYSAVMLFMVIYAWTEQGMIRRGGSEALYRNLMEGDVYVRRGFDLQELRRIPDLSPEAGSPWVFFETRPLHIRRAPLPDMPKRTYLSPTGSAAEEFTLIIPIEMDAYAISYLDDNPLIIPGINFTAMGQNWEVFFNGTMVRSEMHLDHAGQIIKNRTWRNVHFPIDRDLVQMGTNILALRIVGDPTYVGTGLSFRTPHYLDDYQLIESKQRDILLLVLCIVSGYIGINYLTLFLSLRNKKEIFYLYFSIFSLLLCTYTLNRHSIVNVIIPNADIAIRMEYFSLMFSIPAFCMFIEVLGKGKVSKVSWGYLAFCILIALTQMLFSPQFAEDTIGIWNITVLLYASYVVLYNGIYFYFWHKDGPRKKGVTNPLVVNIFIGMFMLYICGIYEVLEVMLFRNTFSIFQYAVFAVQIGMSFILFQRFGGMYKELEQSNIVLENAVRVRTLELEEQTLAAVQASKAKTEFLATMSHEIRTPLNAVIGLSEIELRGELPDSSRDNIIQIHQSGSSLMGIINDILDISKIEAGGGIELIPVEYEIAPLISDIGNLNRIRLGSKPVAFALSIQDDFPNKLFGDELRVRQILNNILSNAVKYTDEGIIKLEISTDKLSVDNNENLRIRFVVTSQA